MSSHLQSSVYKVMNEQLKKCRLQILDEMEPRHFLHRMINSCFHKIQAESIDVLPTRHSRVEKLLTCLRDRDEDIYAQFCLALAGIHPDLFRLLMGKSANRLESEHVISPYIKKVQDKIINSSHETDRPKDKVIDLATQYVQLRVTTVSEERSYIAKANNPPDRLRFAGDMCTSRKINILDVLEEDGGGEKPRLLVIKGRPGIGKTTTGQWLARKWAKNEWGEGYSIIFFLQLRRLCLIRDRISLWKLLADYGLYQVGLKCLGGDTLPVWLEKNQQYILIHLDGLDEISEFQERFETCRRIDDVCTEAEALESCINLIKGNLLPKATVIITSRPMPGIALLKADKIVHLLGLTQSGVLEYVDKFSTDSERGKIKDNLAKNPVVMSLCGITFYCTVICEFLKDCPKLQFKHHGTYTRLHAYIIMRLLARHHPCDKVISCPKAIADDNTDILVPLARLATQGFSTRPQKLVFTDEELYDAGIKDEQLTKVKESGLLLLELVECEGTVWSNRRLLGMFIHLTIQEFFASSCMLLQNAENLDATIRQERLKGDFNMALAFLYGIMYDSGDEYIAVINNALRELYPAPTGLLNWILSWIQPWNPQKKGQDKLKQFYKKLCQSVESSPEIHQSDLKLLIMQLAQESQQIELAKLAARSVVNKGSIAMSGVNLTAVDMTAMTYVLGCTENISGLKLENSNIDDISVKLLSPFLQTQNIQSLDLSGNQISDDGLQALSGVLKGHCKIISLNLSKNDITDDGLSTLSKALEFESCSISNLDMSSNTFGDAGAVTIARALGKNLSLRKLYLNENEIGNEGATLLALALQERNSAKNPKAPRITIIELRQNQIGDNGAEALRLDLPTEKALKVIDLRGNQISGDWIQMYNSKEMLLTKNTTGSERVRQIIRQLQGQRRPWRSLKLTKQRLECCDTHALVWQLFRSITVKTLDLRGNQITDRNAEALELLARTNPNLDCIKLQGNQVREEVVKALEDCLAFRKATRCLSFVRVNFNEVWCQNIEKSVHMSPNLKQIEISETTQTSLLFKEFHSILRSPNIESLILQRCNLCFHDVRGLCHDISNTGHLRALEITDIPLGSEEVSLIAHLLTGSVHLDRLSLARDDINDQGAKQIFEALESRDSTLRILDLSLNEVVDEGARAAGRCLTKNCKLKEINLAGNRISGESALTISRALGLNHTLRHLNLANNALRDDVINDFLHLMSSESQCTISIASQSKYLSPIT